MARTWLLNLIRKRASSIPTFEDGDSIVEFLVLGAFLLLADIGFRAVQEGTVGQISHLVAASIGFASLQKEPFIPMVSA